MKITNYNYLLIPLLVAIIVFQTHKIVRQSREITELTHELHAKEGYHTRKSHDMRGLDETEARINHMLKLIRELQYQQNKQ